MGLRRAVAAGAVLLCLAPALAGCIQVQGCPGWAGYDTPEDAAQYADAVAVGHVLEQVATSSFNGASANVWSVDVDEWLKGEGPERIEVLSVPSACGASADPYLGEDPLDVAARDEESVLFLVGADGGWRTISPSQGVVESTPEGDIPAAWRTP